MKIAYFCKTLIPSRMAASVHIMKMCEALARNGHKVELFVLCERSDDTAHITDNIHEYYDVSECFKIIWIPIFASKLSRARYILSTILVTGLIVRKVMIAKPDIVFGRDLLACCISALIGKRVIFESHFPVWHSTLESLIFKLLLRLSKFEKLVVISESLRQVYLVYYGELDSSKVIIAHDGANNASNQYVARELRGEGGRLDVGYVGHLYKGKGVEVIAKAAPKLLNVNFHIIGGLDKDVAYWKSKIDCPNVFFYGFITQRHLSSYIHKLDVCLLPNQRHVNAFGADSEGRKLKNISDFTSPLKMFEYMAHRKPIIASDLPVLREVISDKSAILVPPDDIGRWIKAIEKLQRNEGLRKELGESGWRLFMMKYTWEKRAGKILEGFI